MKNFPYKSSNRRGKNFFLENIRKQEEQIDLSDIVYTISNMKIEKKNEISIEEIVREIEIFFLLSVLRVPSYSPCLIQPSKRN